MIQSRLIHLIVIAFVCLGFPVSDNAQTNKARNFSIEESMGKTVKIPKRVMALLLAQPRVKEYLENNEENKQELLDGFEAALIDLDSHGAHDVVVKNGVLDGANTGPFWIFTKTASNYRLVLSVTAHDMTISQKKTNGYRNIAAATMTAMEVSTANYRFNGNKYRLKRTKNS